MIRGLLLSIALASAPMAAAQAQPGPAQAQTAQAKQSKADGGNDCFYITQMQNDLPINDHTVLFRVSVSEIYALDFANRCVELTYPSPRLIITPVGGSGLVCHAIDLDIKVGENGGPGDIPTPCIATGLHKLTPAEVAALPKKDIP